MSTIGIFDSGLGGLTGYRALRRLLPRQKLIYFGDNARVPYGTKSREVICRYAMQDVRFLLSCRVQAILVACGTVSSNALELLEEQFSVPFVGVVAPAAKKAVALANAVGGKGRVLVLGTAATIASGAYERAIRALDPAVEVRSAACPLFVPLVENMHIRKGDIAATAIAGEYLLPYKPFCPDAVILGCTHFPLLSEVIADVLPEPVQISAGEESAREMARLLPELPAADQSVGDAFFTSDDPAAFAREAEIFLGAPPAGPVSRVEIERF